MGELVNLRMARKRAKRDRDDQRALENRLVHGRSTAERRFADTSNEKSQKNLDQHRIGTGEGL